MTLPETLESLRTGPGQLRFIVQPLMALLLGLRDGRNDTRMNQPPYFISLFERDMQPMERLRQGAHQVLLPFCVAFAVDAVIQILSLHRWRPLASLIVAFVLIAVPYIAVRGFSNRAFRRMRRFRPA